MAEVSLKGARIGSLLTGVELIGLDSSVLIYQFDHHPVHAKVTARIFNRVWGGLPAVLSTLVFMEILVRPHQVSPKAAAAVAARLKDMSNFSFLPPTMEIANEAARLRAKYRLETPDAIHLATSLIAGADLFITNDEDFRSVAHKEDIRIAFLEDCRE